MYIYIYIYVISFLISLEVNTWAYFYKERTEYFCQGVTCCKIFYRSELLGLGSGYSRFFLI